MSFAIKDLTGQRFGWLVVLSRGKNTESKAIRYKCRCDCGNRTLVHAKHLHSGHTTSCGCKRSIVTREKNTTHGYANRGKKSRLYNIWMAMKQRCSTSNNSHYQYYGGRGIKVCQQWQNDFKTFRAWALSNGYKNNLSIDRIDNDGGYSPENCRWATQKEQALNSNNVKNARKITHNGETMTIREWAEELGIDRTTIYFRLRKLKWSKERAVSVIDGRKARN